MTRSQPAVPAHARARDIPVRRPGTAGPRPHHSVCALRRARARRLAAATPAVARLPSCGATVRRRAPLAGKLPMRRHRVGVASQLPDRVHVEVEDGEPGRVRRVTLLKTARGGMREWVAFDSLCYHAGGRLGHGALALYDGRLCITCPVHLFEIDVWTGQRVLRGGDDEDGDGDAPRLRQGAWTGAPRTLPGGRRQRTHDVIVEKGVVYIRLRLAGGPVDSDDYANRFLGAALDW